MSRGKRKQDIYNKAHEAAEKYSANYSDTGDTFSLYVKGDPLKETKFSENLAEAGKINSFKKKRITKLFQILEQKERELEAKKRAEDEVLRLAKEKAAAELKALEDAEEDEDEDEEVDLTEPKKKSGNGNPVVIKKEDEKKKEDKGKQSYVPPKSTVTPKVAEDDDWEFGTGSLIAGGLTTAALLAYLYPGTRKYVKNGFKLAGKGLWAPFKYTGRGAKSIYNRMRGAKGVAKDLEVEQGAVSYLPINKRGPLALPPKSGTVYTQKATFSPVNPIPGRPFSQAQLTTGSPLGLPNSSGLPTFNTPRYKSGGRLIQRNK